MNNSIDEEEEGGRATKFDALIPDDSPRKRSNPKGSGYKIVSGSIKVKIQGTSKWSFQKIAPNSRLALITDDPEAELAIESENGEVKLKADISRLKLKVSYPAPESIHIDLSPCASRGASRSFIVKADLESSKMRKLVDLDFQRLKVLHADLSVALLPDTTEKKSNENDDIIKQKSADILNALRNPSYNAMVKSVKHYMSKSQERGLLPLTPEMAKKVDEILQKNRKEIDEYKDIMRRSDLFSKSD